MLFARLLIRSATEDKQERAQCGQVGSQEATEEL